MKHNYSVMVILSLIHVQRSLQTALCPCSGHGQLVSLAFSALRYVYRCVSTLCTHSVVCCCCTLLLLLIYQLTKLLE